MLFARLSFTAATDGRERCDRQHLLPASVGQQLQRQERTWHACNLTRFTQCMQLFLRIDPGTGRGHHKNVKTAGTGSKFGITLDDVAECAQLCNDNNMRGLLEISCSALRCAQWLACIVTAAAGSLMRRRGRAMRRSWRRWQTNTFRTSSRSMWAAAWASRIAGRTRLAAAALTAPPEPTAQALDLDSVTATLSCIRARFPKYELWMEPGRFVVAECCAIVSRVTQIKRKAWLVCDMAVR